MTFRDGKTLGTLFGQSLFISLFGGLLFWRLSNEYINAIPFPIPNVPCPEDPGIPNMEIIMNRIGSLFF